MGWLDWIPSWLVNYGSFEETENEDLESIGIVAGYNVAAALCFWLYWTWKRWDDPGFFSPKRAQRPPDLPGSREGPFAWIWSLYRISEEDFLRFAGFDALVYIRMYLLAGKICATIAVVAIPVILPINLSGDYVENDNLLNKMSMSNIRPASTLLWAHTAGMYFLTAVCLFFLRREFKAYIQLRQRYLQQRKPHMRTIMLDLPRDARSNAILESYFSYLYPDSVLSAVCTQDLHVLRRLLEKRGSVLTKLERAELQKRKNGGREPRMWTGPCCCLGERVDSVAYLTQELSYYNTEVSREQAKRLHHLRKIDERALQMASQGTLQQAIQAIMAQGGNQEMLDDEETGLVERLLRKNSTRAAQGFADPALPRDPALHDAGPFVRVLSESSTSDDETAVETGALLGRPASGNAGRRRTGSSLAEIDDIGGFGGGGGGSGSGAGGEDQGGERKYLSRKRERRRATGGRGLSALIPDPFRSDDDEGVVSDEARPLLGLSSTSSKRLRTVEFPEMTPRAFITFKTFSAATVARQVLHGAAPGRMAAEESPEPRDIYWFNTGITKKARNRRRYLVEAFLLLLYVFYVIPVTLLYLVLSADAVTSYAKWIAQLYLKSSIFAALVEQLQPVALLALMNTLPPLIRLLGMAEGFAAESRNQQAVLSRYFYFQVINVFLVTTIAGTLLDTVSEIVEDPEKTFTLLGEGLPKVCGFFCEYIILKMFAGLWIELSRTISLIQEYILRVIWPRETPRDRAAVVLGIRPYFDAGWFNYPKYYAQDLLVVVVCLTYAIINPFILVLGVPYFFACHVTYKHQMLFVYEPLYETGGVFFPKIFRRFIFALIIAQATMVGVLLLKIAYYEAGFVFALIVLTWCSKSSLRGSYEPAALSLPLEIAKVLDDVESPRRPSRDHEDSQGGDARTAYLQPSLKAEPLARPELERDHPANIDFERYRGRV